MNRIIYLVWWLSLAVFSAPSFAVVEQQQMLQAEQCATINVRIKRLSCFDHVFNVALNNALGDVSNQFPKSWYRAMDTANSDKSTTVLVTEGEGKGSNAWITLVALNEETSFEQNEKPVLMMSCIDNLSRVEIALPSRVQDARVEVSVANQTGQIWRSDDAGVLMSSARGIPAINTMKAVSQQHRLLLRSNASFIDGLLFDTHELSNVIGALRQRCGW